MITLQHVHYEIHDEVSNNDKVHNSFIKNNKKSIRKHKILTIPEQFTMLTQSSHNP